MARTPVKVALRRSGSTLVGVRASAPQRLVLVGHDVLVSEGDWLIYIGNAPEGSPPIDHILVRDFPGPYEIVAEGTLTLSRANRDQLEETLGIGATRSATDLAVAVQRLARIQIGDVRIPFTPGQLEELQDRARKRGQTVGQAIQAVIDRIRDELFWRG